jgi:hypothetical protein
MASAPHACRARGRKPLCRRGRTAPGPLAGFDLVLDQPETVFFDGALLRDGDNDWAGYIAAHLKPWPGGIAFYRSPGSSGFRSTRPHGAGGNGPARLRLLVRPDLALGPRQRAVGRSVLRHPRLGRRDSPCSAGPMRSRSRTRDGEWEVVQFATAELVSAGRYKLTNLLRGQRGSEHAMASPVAAGARVLVLTTALGQPGIAVSDVGLPIVWRAGPANRDVADASFVEETVTMTGKGRRPLSPVHVAGRRPKAPTTSS